MKTKKTGISTGTIINPRLESRLQRKQERINKNNNCNKCKNFYKNNSWCCKYNFKVSTIELGSKCKGYDYKSKSMKK